MEVPEGVTVGEHERGGVVLKLNKSLYGLKQSPRCWNLKFKKFLSVFNLVCSEGDPCIFVGEFNGETVLMALFVDDGLVAAKSESTLNLMARQLSEEFAIKVGDASSFVGVQISRDRVAKTLVIYQSSFIRKIIDKYGMRDAKAVSVPVVRYIYRETDISPSTYPLAPVPPPPRGPRSCSGPLFPLPPLHMALEVF